MKTIAKNIIKKNRSLIIVVFCLIGILLACCLSISFVAHAEENNISDNAFTPEFIVNKYDGGNAILSNNSIKVTSNICDKQLTFNSGSWYKNNNTGLILMDTQQSDDIAYACLNTENAELSVSFYDVNDEYNVLTVNTDSEFIEHINESSIFDDNIANNLISNNRLLYAGLTNTRTTTYYSDGRVSTADNESDNSWTKLSESDIDQLKQLTSDKTKKQELLNIGQNVKEIRNITDFIPEKYFAIETGTVFIGQEYGFALLSSLYEQSYTYYRHDIYKYFVSVIMFTIERESTHVINRQYPVTLNIAFHASGTCYYLPNGWGNGEDECTKDVFISKANSGYESLFIADPMISSRINNLYDINEYYDDYDIYKDSDMSISQVRLNYNGYDGDKQKKKYESSQSASSLAFTAASGLFSAIKIFATGSAGNPVIALGLAGYKIFNAVDKYIDGQQLVYKNVSANNENNIFTFDAPSVKPNKYAISCIGYDSNESDEFTYLKGSRANILFGKYGHYAQSIFVLNEVNKPTAITSYVNFALGFQSVNKKDPHSYRYPIPDKYNYSRLTVKLWDDGYKAKVNCENETDVYTYADNKVALNCIVDDDGYYSLKIKDFTRLFMSSNRDSNENITGQKIDDLDSFQGNIIKGATGNVADGIISLPYYLKKGSNDIVIELADINNKPCLGASFKARIEKKLFDLNESGNISADLCSNEIRLFKFTANQTGIYTINSTTANMDILNERNIVISANRKKGDVLLTQGNVCYVVVKNTTASALSTSISVKHKEVSEEMKFEGSFDSDSANAWYPVKIENKGIYTVSVKGDVRVELKDDKPRDVMFGSKKAILSAGIYYLYVENTQENETEYNITFNFEPSEMKAAKPYNVFVDTSYKYIPVITGKYKITSYSDDYTVTISGGKYNNVQCNHQTVDLECGGSYIITAKSKSAILTESDIQIDFVPEQNGVITFNNPENIIVSSVAFKNTVDGQFIINSDSVSVYSEDMTLINKVNDTYLLAANNIYYIINEGGTACNIEFHAKRIPINTKFNVLPNNKSYYSICPDKSGSYFIEANGKALIEVFEYSNLSNGTKIPSTGSSYIFDAHKIYYICITTNANPDVVTLYDGTSNKSFEITDDLIYDCTISDNNNKTSYYYTPNKDGSYKFIFYRDRNVEYNIKINENGNNVKTANFESMNFVLSFALQLKANIKYEINYESTSEIDGSTSLAFGIFKTMESSDFNVYVDGRLQDTSGDANIIALKSNGDGYTVKQIAVSKQFGNVTYKVLNAPIVNNSAAVTVNGNGLLNVSNKLSQWTSFAVEVNIGRCKYGDIILDEGISKVISFVVYNKVENIEIFDEDNALVTIVDVAPNNSIDLYAKIYPLFAAQANTLSFNITGNDKKYISLNSNGNGVTIYGIVTTPNNTFARVYASCGDEFTVIVMVRVHAEEINATSKLNLNDFSGGTAYEIIVETGDIGTLDLSTKTDINYLKIRGGSVKELNDFNLKLGSRSFVLILEDITIHGTVDGVLNSSSTDLSVYFSNFVELYGKDGESNHENGSSTLIVSSITIHQIGTQTIIIQGGNGYSYNTGADKEGGCGGIAISSTKSNGRIEFKSINNIYVKGGNGGNGANGSNGANATEDGQNGDNGNNGKNGGSGASAIHCAGTLKLSGNIIKILGGNGGNGGHGGNGGNGGNGAKGSASNGGVKGQRGGDGGNGGDGALGGNGAVAIENNTDISWQTNWTHSNGENGVRGDGGNGGNGGRGGNGADDNSVSDDSSAGGDGGNGGNGGEGNKNGRMGDGGDGGNGGDPGSNGPGERGGNGGYGYNGGNGGNGGSTGMWWQDGGNGGNGGDAYGGTVGQGGKGGSSGAMASDGSNGSAGQQKGEKHKPDA